MKSKITLSRSALLCLAGFVLLSTNQLKAQFLIKKEENSQSISIHSKSEYVDVGNLDVSLEQIRTIKAFDFRPMEKENRDFGFTTHNFWLRFHLKNVSDEELTYFFETARPITDLAELYVIKSNGKITKYLSGDAIPYSKRSFDHRKTIFKISLFPNEQQQFYLHIKSDGEMLSMPMLLHTLHHLL